MGSSGGHQEQPSRSTVGKNADELWQILENSPDIILLVDREGMILYMNRVVSGFTLEQVIGSSSYNFMPPDFQEEYGGFLERVFSTGESLNYEMPGDGPDGRPAWYFSSMSPVVRDGEVIAATIITRDITERRELEARVQDAYERERAAADRLRELDRIKREFTAKVVHDLRTPVTIIDGFAATLTSGWETFDEAARRDYVDQIAAASARLSNLVQDVLDVARLESADYSYDIQPTDVAATIAHVVESLGHGGERIEVDVDASTPAMLVDPMRHEQVLDNLISNAVKFSPEESTITIRAYPVDDAVCVEVTDQGVGIDAADAERLFQRYTQLDPPDRGTPTGSGLGLYICRTIVEAQGGTIEVESNPGSGSTFRYRLPAARP